MTNRNTQGENLTLLVTFKAIYETHSISAAANMLGITQSAASKHLQKLRHWLKDPVFVRTSTGMEPTRKAESLITQAESIIMQMRALNSEAKFCPSQLQGRFVISTTSEVCQQLAKPLLSEIEQQAPKLNLAITNLEQDYSSQKLEMGSVNLVISVNWHAPPSLKQKRLFSDKFVCIMGAKHPLADVELTQKNYAESPHFLVAPLGKTKGFIDQHLESQNLQRNIKLTLPTFDNLSPELLGDEYLVTLPHEVAKTLHAQSNMVIKQLPFYVPHVDYYVFWHQRFDNESSNKWMRELVTDIFLN